MNAEGELTVTPVNPVTGERGETAIATIADSQELLLGSK
jgi:hypothetical protein